jgi:hypothetical protein
MNAKGTWDLWRRILREPALAERLFDPDLGDHAARFGLSPEDMRIARAYASTPKETQFFITTYRYRLVSSFGHALQSCAPLTYRTLKVRGQDMRALGERCLDELGWCDMGPFVYRFCGAILRYLRDSELAATLPGLLEVTALEGAAVDLVQRLARTPAPVWVPREERAVQAQAIADLRFQHTGTGIVAHTERSLTPWLRNRSEIGKAPLEDIPEWYLIYLPSVEEGVRLVPVGAIGGALFQMLAEPCSAADLAERAAQAGLTSSDEHLRWLARYVELGVVAARPTEGPASAESRSMATDS